MGKKATDRIKRITTKLMMEGNTVQSKVVDNRQRCRSCKRYKGFEGFNEAGLCPSCVSVQSSDCCVGSLSRLPDGVVSCPDCPLD
jgi:hypothetical protein